MAAKKPSPSSPTKSSPARSRAGEAAPRVRAAAPGDGLALLAAADGGRFPTALYVEGGDEALKAAFLAEWRHAWAESCAEAPHARIFDAGESGVDEVLAAYHSVSMFTPRELILVFGVEDLTRSEKKVAALAEGAGRPAGETCLVLIERAADGERKTLAPLRAACAARWRADTPDPGQLQRWAERRFATERVTAEAGVIARLLALCEGDALAFFNELAKLLTLAGPGGRTTLAEVEALAAPMIGADVPDYLAAVAMGDVGRATTRLSRALAAGTSEGTLLFALANMAGGGFGGWSMHRELSGALAGRLGARGLAEALDAVYRAESAWKGGRADATLALEQATRAVAGGGPRR